ncbi:CYTH domain-containing protein [Neobacillus mesonae]|uniref:CYTH domain-containing protein n=1 Tax=Neobacillus mesonae TaxID=1193713 RepID=UPI00203ECC92|nr:CYTH domain-containing protein [Neobacillus mesonae]MCM3569980.1 CYTH domain-containing protein [Neobacillus mesonae]
MTQNIEIEFKNMLTKQEYERLLREFHIEEYQIFSQENHYFDTAEFSLKSKGSALRIRKKQDQFEMTLKQPQQVGLLETNQMVNQKEVSNAIQSGVLPPGEIEKIIEKEGIQFPKIKYFGSLLTNRVELKYKNGLLVLDHSIYLNKEDFELEFEAADYQEGKGVFNELLKQFEIPIRKTKNKIQRFYEQKYSQDSNL